MEFVSSLDRDDSPSQEEIRYGHPIKQFGDSPDDFEHISKDSSPAKEATSLFLQHETSYASNQHSNVPRQSETAPLIDDVKDEQDVPKFDSDAWGASSSSDSTIPVPNDPIGEPNFDEDSQNDDNESSQSLIQNEKFEANDILLPKVSKIDATEEDKPIDEDDTSLDFGGVLRNGDFVLSNNSEILTGSLTDKNSSNKPTSQSMPGIINPDDGTDVLAEFVGGDGLHFNQPGLDNSDNDDFIPEPLPKDYPEIGVIGAKDLLSALGLGHWFRPGQFNPKVEALIYWRDPKKSGIAFGTGLALLLSLCSFSLISVVAYASLTVLIGSISFRLYELVLQAVQKTSDGHPFKPHLLKVLTHPILTEVFNTIKEFLDIDLSLNPEKTREVLESVVQHLNNGIIELRRLFLVEDIVDSLKFGVLLWAMTYVGSWFNGLSLIIIAYVGLFTLFKVYEMNKAQIDANLDVAKGKISEIIEKVKAVVPLGKKPEQEKKKDE